MVVDRPVRSDRAMDFISHVFLSLFIYLFYLFIYLFFFFFFVFVCILSYRA